MSNNLNINTFLENRSRTIRRSNPRTADFCAVMAKRITPDIITREDFLRLANEVFSQNEIAKKAALKTWDVFTFQRVVQEVLGQ